jgi:ParB/RepB/Spo0J family partition protein
MERVADARISISSFARCMMPECQIQQISRKAIRWREQERKTFSASELSDLAATIRVHGILEPIGVIREGERYIGLWGQRRWMAAESAGLESVPAIVRDAPATEAEAIELRMIENLARESLRPMEQAVGLDQLQKASGLAASEVAKRVGITPAAFTKSLSLLQLPEPIRQQIDQGLISPAAGYELARVQDPKLRAELAAQVAAGTLTRDALSGKIRATKKSGDVAAESKRSRVTAKLNAGRLITVSATNLTVETVITTLEDLLSRCRAARTKGLTLQTMLKVLADESKQSS